MNSPLSCGAQDMLEAAIVQRRRLDMKCLTTESTTISYRRVLPIDVGTTEGIEQLTIMATDNDGGIIKIAINTADIIEFEAKDFNDPRIKFSQPDSHSCRIK